MLLSKFGAESLPQKKKSSFKIYYLLIFLLAAGSGAYWIIKNYERLVFNFKKDKYANIIADIERVNEQVATSGESAGATETEELLSELINDNPDDSYLYFLSGNLYSILTCNQLLNDGEKLTDLLFLEYIKKPEFPSNLSHDQWEKGVAYTRKALLLELPENETRQAREVLAGFYLIGGSPYWESARPYLSPEMENKFLVSLYRLVFGETEPDWQILMEKYGNETSGMWNALYNLKIRNYPLAFYHLKNLLLSENVSLRNKAYYLMGFVMGEQKNMQLKLYYHSMINYEEFLKTYPWFLEEHNYTLRFMGQDAAARAFLKQYEQMVIQVKEAL